MVVAEHLAHVLHAGDGLAGPYLGCETERAAVVVAIPVGRRFVIVRPLHLDSGRTDRCGITSGRGDRRVRPLRLGDDLQILPLDLRRRELIAAIPERQAARMVAQKEKLVTKARRGEGFCRAIPIAPLLPIVTAAETGNDEDPVLVREVKQMVRAKLPLETHGVKPHVVDQAHLLLFALGCLHEEKIARPTRAADEDGTPVNVVKAVAFRRDFRSRLTHTKADRALVRHFVVHGHAGVQVIHFGGAVTDGPPQSRLRQVQAGVIDSVKTYPLGAAAGHPHRDRGHNSIKGHGHDAGHRLVAGILQLHRDDQVRGGEIGGQAAAHERVVHAQDAAGGNEDVAPQALHFVGRHRGPVHPGVSQILGPLALDPQRERVSLPWPRGLGYVEGETAHGSSHLIGVGDLLAIEPDVRAIVDPLEVERDRSSRHLRRQVELRPKPPTDREGVGPGHAGVGGTAAAPGAHARPGAQVRADERVRVHARLREHPRNRRGNGSGVPPAGGETGFRDGLPIRLPARSLHLPAIPEHKPCSRGRPFRRAAARVSLHNSPLALRQVDLMHPTARTA